MFQPDVQAEDDQDEPSDEEFDESNDEDEGYGESDEQDSDREFRTPRRITTNISVVEEAHMIGALAGVSKKHRKIVNEFQSPIPLNKGKRVRPRPPPPNADRLRTRGVADFSKIGGQEIRLKDLFGPGSEDLKPILTTRDYWSTQETLPLRQDGGLRRSFFERDGAREKEVQILQNWYADVGREAFARGQTISSLSLEESRLYRNTPGPDSLNILWGPIDEPQLLAFKKDTYANISEPWKENKDRRGWLFNLGSRIQDAQWAVDEEGSTQYLAVATEQRPAGRQPQPLEYPKAPAFCAAKPFPASIQIWGFEATDDLKMDTSIEPRLQILICTKWGAPKQFRWCPIKATQDQKASGNTEDKHIGLLAGIWSDGKARILDISIPRTDINSAEPLNLFYSRAAFEISLPNTIPTCLHWLSATSLAIATTAGTVGIWTLTRPESFPSTVVDQFIPKPWFYHQLADTYILTMASGWPSQPHFLSVSIADGFARLYDLRSPLADTTASIRGRTLCISQVWHEQTQSFAMPDEHYILKHNPIRRYYHNLYTMRLESSIMRVAACPVHPAILIGGAEGNVEASNPVGRIANYKVIPWQQKWFVHEWRGPVDKMVVKPANDGDTEMSEDEPDRADTAVPPTIPAGAPSDILSQPLVRITEGYKATQPGIQHSVMSKKPMNPEVGKGITVFEENSGITALAWNPSLKYGTWAVAGMASGLLRVEDLGV